MKAIFSKNTEFLLLLFWNVPAFFLSLCYGNAYLVTAVIIIGVPAVYLTLRKPKIFQKVGWVSMILAISGGCIFSYLAHADGSWYTPSNFPRMLHMYPLEDIVWGFLYFYYTIAVYEYFYEKEKILKFPKHFGNYVKMILFTTVLFSLVAYLVPSICVIPYFYAIFIAALVIVVPWWMLQEHEILIVKVVKVEIFLLIPSLVLEYVAAVNHNWWFPGHHFTGMVSSLGVNIPLEEFLWILLFVPALIVYYEVIADDEK